MSADNKQAAKPKRKIGGITRTTWQPGCPSPNPGGRPRRALAMAEAVRTELDPAEWVAFELAIARDEAQPLETRRASWLALIDRGFVKAPTTIDVTTHETSSLDLSSATDEQLRQALALIEATPGQQPGALPTTTEPIEADCATPAPEREPAT